MTPLARGLQHGLAEAVDSEPHAIARRRKFGGDTAPGHHDHATLEAAAAAVEEVREPGHGFERMAHGVAGLALASGLIVHPAARHRALEIDAAPLDRKSTRLNSSH